MNLINKEVKHKHFGEGHIVKHNDSLIVVDFGTENKKFIFPDAFEKYLKLQDKAAANSIEKVIEKKEIIRKQEKQKLIEEKKLEWKKRQLRLEHEKLMNNHKLHPQSQAVFWCDQEEQNNVFTEWQVFTGVINSGKNKGKPRKLSRLHQNSACLLTARDSDTPEQDRQIIGVYMVNEEFIGKLREDGYIPAHTKYRIKLTEEESSKMPFWKYYINEKSPDKMTWNTGKYRYFDNLYMAQILLDIVSLKNDAEEKELAQQFFNHFCKMNQILPEELSEPNGALTRM